MDTHFQQLTDEFITQRVGHYGKNEPEAVGSAFVALKKGMEALRVTLGDEQLSLFRVCENAISLISGETDRYYYVGGFKDAIAFLIGWGNDAQPAEESGV